MLCLCQNPVNEVVRPGIYPISREVLGLTHTDIDFTEAKLLLNCLDFSTDFIQHDVAVILATKYNGLFVVQDIPRVLAKLCAGHVQFASTVLTDFMDHEAIKKKAIADTTVKTKSLRKQLEGAIRRCSSFYFEVAPKEKPVGMSF